MTGNLDIDRTSTPDTMKGDEQDLPPFITIWKIIPIIAQSGIHTREINEL